LRDVLHYKIIRIIYKSLLRKMFGPKRDEMRRKKRSLHKDGLCALFSSANISQVTKSRRMIWAEHVACLKVRRPEGRKPLERPRSRWEDTTEMNLEEEGWRMNRITVAQDRDMWRALMKEVMKFRISINCGKFLGIAEDLLASQEGLCPIDLDC
jgi:hypothetical protein